MSRSCRQTFSLLMTLALGIVCLLPPNLPAQDHIVTPADLHQAIKVATRDRQQNLTRVENFFSEAPVKRALKAAKIDDVQVKKAIPALSDEELARLASSTAGVQQDFAAGSLTNEQLTYIVIALATAVIVILIVEH